MAAAAKTDAESDLDRLYQLPLSEFTSARDELAKRLRAEGATAKAQAIKKLRKPTAAVWLVNQLAHERPLDVQRLLKAGESLTKSQAKAAAGKSSTFDEARRDEHRALEQLAKAASELAERAGIGSPALAKATETLRAASLSAEGRELLRRGRLSEELEPPGFEALTGLVSPRKARTAPRAERRRAAKEARERLRRLRAEERELVTAARDAAREAERAEAEAAAARERAAEAQKNARAASDRREAAEADGDGLG